MRTTHSPTVRATESTRCQHLEGVQSWPTDVANREQGRGQGSLYGGGQSQRRVPLPPCRNFSNYRSQRSWAKVMFLQASVILSTAGGGVCLSACWNTTPPGSRPPWIRHQPGADTPWSRHPPGSRHQHTVNERPVHILLECILVSF